MEKEVAVRFYENKRYGSTYAKGAFHKAVFNGTADLALPSVKYLLDMLEFSAWGQSAKSDADIEILNNARDLLALRQYDTREVLGTFIKRLNRDGSKSRVSGFAVLDLNSRDLVLAIDDADMEVAQLWQLEAKACRAVSLSKNSPQLLATNVDLN